MRDPATHVQIAFFRDGRLNAILADDGPDHATLRRHLVDEGFLRRDHGTYWRVER